MPRLRQNFMRRFRAPYFVPDEIIKKIRVGSFQVSCHIIWNLIWSDDEVFLLILIDPSEFRQQLFCACKHPLLFGSGWILISKPTISVAFVVTSTVNRRISLSLLWLTVWNLFARFKTSWWAFQLTGIVGLGANFNAFVKLS